MARVTCQECHMEFNAALRRCPNCGRMRPQVWRQALDLHWPLPLGIGLAMQTLAQQTGPEQGRPGAAGLAVQQPGLVVSVAHFVTGVLVFAVVAALLLLIIQRVLALLRRRSGRRRRRKARDRVS